MSTGTRNSECRGNGASCVGQRPLALLMLLVLCCCCLITQPPGVGCACPDGWTGDACKTDIDECRDGVSTCAEYSECTNTPGAFSCACLPGFSGNGFNCKDIDECAGGNSNCSSKATCSNQVGKYECTCNTGFYGNGSVCYDETMLPTTDATELTDVSNGQQLSAQLRSSVPFLVGDAESSVLRIGRNGFIIFTDKPAPDNMYYPMSPYQITMPIVLPYWTRELEYVPHRRRSIRAAVPGGSHKTSRVQYELMDSSARHSARHNWQRAKQIVEQFTREAFEPLSVLVVTWRIRIPTVRYMMELDCVGACSYGRYEALFKGWRALCQKWCDDIEAAAAIEFQAVVTRNRTHSYAVFNYGKFQLPLLRLYSPARDLYSLNLFAAAGFTDGYSTGDELAFSRRTDWPEQHNLALGNSGRRGRHVMQLSSWYSPSSQAAKCADWLETAEASRSVRPAPACASCPPDLRTAVLDRRYSAYEFRCSGTSLRMCFTSSSYRCAGRFAAGGGSCSPADSWECDRRTCQYLLAPRCCYHMTVAAGGELHKMCGVDHLSLWSIRGRMRLVMFDMRPSGYLISLGSEGAGHAMLFVRDSVNDSQFWFDDTQQYRTESYGQDVCRAAGLMAGFADVRPVCTSKDYQPPTGGFQRGDPHLSTLANRSYTFNGHCEYHLLLSQSPKSPPLWLQARTKPVTATKAGSSSPGAAGATAFVAFALKSGTNPMSVAVVRDDSADDLDVLEVDAGGNARRLGGVRRDLVARSNATRLGSYRIEAIDNRSVSVTDEFAGVGLTVAMETNSLRSNVQVDPAKFTDGVDGLLGNSHATGFKLRNGSVLPAGSSERQLFEFGNSWRLRDGDASFLPYPAGTGRSKFCNTTFVPTFAEDYKDSLPGLFGGITELFTAADSTCRKSSAAYLSCMFDAGQLRSLAAASDAATAAGEEAATRAALANRPPEFTGAAARIRVKIGGSVDTEFEVVDPDGGATEPELTVAESVGGEARLQSTGGSSTRLTWTSTGGDGDARLRLVATDALGGIAAWTPAIVLCDCRNGGSCCADCSRGATAAFQLEKCRCSPGFTGDRCERAIESCTGNCTDGAVSASTSPRAAVAIVLLALAMAASAAAVVAMA